MNDTFFKIDGRPIASKDWGDYGDILQHGMTAHSPRVAGLLSLERTGPYIPPITLPGVGSILVTDEARQALQTSGLTGFTFLAVEKKLIVNLPWNEWDLEADEPAQYPASGEPEDYILQGPHSPTAATQMGAIWELVVPVNVTVVRATPVVNSYRELYIDLATWDGSDLLRSRDYGGMLFSKRAAEWFSERWHRFLRFDPFSAL